MLKKMLSYLCVILMVATLVPAQEASTSNKGMEKSCVTPSIMEGEIESVESTDIVYDRYTPDNALNLFVTETVEINQPEMAKASSTDWTSFLNDVAGDYAFIDLAKRSNGSQRQGFYRLMETKLNEVFASDEDIEAIKFNYGGEATYFDVLGPFKYSDFGLTSQEAVETYYMLLADHPVYFFATSTTLYSSSNFYVILTEGFEDGEARITMATDTVNTVRGYETEYSEASDYEVALGVHDEIITAVDYAYDEHDNPVSEDWAHTIIGFVDDTYQEVVCEGYAKAYQMILNALDIDNILINGWGSATQLNDNYLHAWNLVEMEDGKYYFVDLTWDDQPNYLDGITHIYFLLGSEEMSESHTCFQSTNTGNYFLYDLPNVGVSNYDNDTTNPAPDQDPDPEPLDTPELRNVSHISTSVNEISWNAVENAELYRVYRKDNAASSWVLLGTTTGLSYKDTASKAGVTYGYTVQAVSEDNESTYDTDGIKALATPTIKNITSASATKNVITWTTVAQATGYRIYRKTTTGSWSVLTTLSGANLTSYTDSTAKSGTVYYYIVRAVRTQNGVTATGWNSVSVISLATPTLKNVKANSTTKNTVTWNKVTGATGYRIYRKTTGGWTAIANVSGNATTSYVDTKASATKQYTYTVRALRTANGTTAAGWYLSGIKNLVTPSLKAVTSSQYNTLKVTYSAVSGATGYIVYRKVSGGGWARVGTTSSTTFYDKTCTTGKVYYYTVRAYKGTTSGSISYYVTAGKSGKAVPATPTLKSAKATTGRVTLSWAKVTGATGYRVYRKTAGGSWSCIKVISSGSTVSYRDTTAKAGETYYYTVRAYRTVSGISHLGGYNSTGLKVKAK